MCKVQDMTPPESWGSKKTSQAHGLLRQPHHHRPGQNRASHFSSWTGQRRVSSVRTEALAALAQRCPSGPKRLQPPAVQLWAEAQADCLICASGPMEPPVGCATGRHWGKDDMENRAGAPGSPDSVPISQSSTWYPVRPGENTHLQAWIHRSKCITIWMWNLFYFDVFSFTKT